MGLLYKPKNTNSEDTFPENELEKLLMDAFNNETIRNEFYLKFLWSDLYVLTSPNSLHPKGTNVLESGDKVEFVAFENGFIPIFSAFNRIFDKGVVKEQVPYLAVKGQDLFELATGADFVLNPYSDYGKEFKAAEIEIIMAASSLSKKDSEIILPKHSKLEIGPPIALKLEMVSTMATYFNGLPGVKAAYIASIRLDEDDNKTHSLVGIDVQSEVESLNKEVAQIAKSFLDKDEILDIMIIDPSRDIGKYLLKNITPFYEREV